MTWYPDLGTETMVTSGNHVRAIGWLSSGKPFPTGGVPHHFVERLRLFTERACESGDALWFGAFGGWHACELCRNHIGTANLGVPSGEVLYVAPEMISHYVEEHDYAPPTDFVAAVMSCPLPGTPEYDELAAPFNRLQKEGLERLRQERVDHLARLAVERGATDEVIREIASGYVGMLGDSVPEVCERIRRSLPKD